jgi:hypothetical protein
MRDAGIIVKADRQVPVGFSRCTEDKIPGVEVLFADKSQSAEMVW